jgi:hypothetical protein
VENVERLNEIQSTYSLAEIGVDLVDRGRVPYHETQLEVSRDNKILDGQCVAILVSDQLLVIHQSEEGGPFALTLRAPISLFSASRVTDDPCAIQIVRLAILGVAQTKIT